MMFKCELIQTIQNRPVQKECFFREGNSIEEVRKTLEMFDFGKGIWHITPVEDEDEGEF